VALDGWIEAVEAHFVECSIAAPTARELAQALVSGLEGARTVARIQGRDEVFGDLAKVIRRAIRP
jgi:hypothetical protein